MRIPFASNIILDIAASLGVTVELEPEYGFAGEIVFGDGKRHLFKNTNFNLNPAGSTEIAKDKGYTSYFLRKHGLNVPNGRTFFSDELNKNLPENSRRGINEALTFSKEVGYPVFIKPNNLSQGVLVFKAYSDENILNYANRIFQKANVLIIEEACIGSDYRVVVLDNKIISAYKRVPLKVVGDGKNTIYNLLKISRDNLSSLGRPNAEIDLNDSRIHDRLSRDNLTIDFTPKNNETIFLLDNANLSTGGTSIDITNNIHSSFSDIAITATKALGLVFSGVDIICDDLELDAKSQKWNIIEVNAAPGLDNYASLGNDQRNIVKNLYKEIIIYLSKK